MMKHGDPADRRPTEPMTAKELALVSLIMSVIAVLMATVLGVLIMAEVLG